MTEFAKFQEQLEQDSIKASLGPGLYRMNMAQKENTIAYPWAPTIRIQKIGASTIQGTSLIDIDSELMNITRINSKDPQMKYKPDETKKITYNHLKDGLFHQESSLLTNPPSTLRGLNKNRWENLFFNPQENSVEPFKLLGTNTHLSLVDNYQACPVISVKGRPNHFGKKPVTTN